MKKTLQNGRKRIFAGALVSGLFALCTTADFVFAQPGGAAAWGGYGLFFWCLYGVAVWGVFSFLDRQWQESPRAWWDRFCRRPMVYSAVCLFACWLLPLVLKYPGTISPDEGFGLMQGLGQSPLRARQPIFHSKLLALFYRVGQSIGSENMGIFLFVTVQMLCLIFAVSYMIRFLVRIRAPRWSVMVTLAFFCFSPFVTGYIGNVRKDAWFMTAFVMYTVVVAEFVFLEGEFWKEAYRPVFLALSAMAMGLFRNGVAYLLLVCGGLLLLGQLRRKERGAVRKCLALLLAAMLPLLAVKTLEAVWKPWKTEVSESLSFPLQQTARFVRDHPELVTPEEREVIGKLWPYEQIAQTYDPYIADPLKYIFREEITEEELRAYFRVWAEQGLRAPGCYAAATLEQNYTLLDPLYNNYQYVFSDVDSGGYVVTPEALRPIQDAYLAFTAALHELPVLSVVNNMAVYNILFLILLAYACFRRERWHLMYHLPIFLFLVGVIAGPCIRGHMRYSFPMIYHLPFLAACLAAPRPDSKKTP